MIVDRSFFTSEKRRMTNQLAFLARRDYFYLDAFWRVNLGMYIIRSDICYHLKQMSHCKDTAKADCLLNCLIFKIVSI